MLFTIFFNFFCEYFSSSRAALQQTLQSAINRFFFRDQTRGLSATFVKRNCGFPRLFPYIYYNMQNPRRNAFRGQNFLLNFLLNFYHS